MPMEEFSGCKIILDVEQAVKVGKEMADNVLTIFEELIFLCGYANRTAAEYFIQA